MGNSCFKPAKCADASSGIFVESRKIDNKAAEGPSLSNQIKTSEGQDGSSDKLKLERLISSNLKSFSFADLKNASKNFRSEIGEGGFGFVYKGWIDTETLTPTKPGIGTAVAIKILKSESFQGHKEWLAEVNYLGTLRHPNIVKLVGYCAESDKRVLVYEFMSKGSLESHLFRKSSQGIPWVTRMQIATSVARGLAFLHSLNANVIYRDLKSSNILLDSDFNAKLSDFGLARDGPTGDKTHVSTRVLGTQGYAAPEYVATGHLALRSDVYSFGVVLLELLSGRRSLGDERASHPEETVVDWAKLFLVDNRRVLRIMDNRLGGQYSKKGAQTAAALALQCLHIDPKFRPSMKEVLSTLENLTSLKDITRP